MMNRHEPTSRTAVTDNGKGRLLRNLLRYGVPFVITVGLCWMLFKNIDLATMMETIREKCRWEWIWLTLGFSFLSFFIRATRWRIQLKAIGVNVSLYPVVLSIFGTYAVNLVFPRLGELWRTGYIAQHEDAPFDKVFGSMVADRLADTISVGLLTLATFFIAGPQLAEYLQISDDTRRMFEAIVSSPWTWAAVALTLALIWSGIVLWRKSRRNRTPAPDRPAGAVRRFCKGLWEGFSVVLTMRGRGRWLILTLALWGCYFTQFYVSLFAFPETAEMLSRHGVTAALFCFVASSISMAVPSNGGIGPWQWAVIFGLGIFGSDVPGLTSEVATSFANLVMGTQTLLLIAVGLFTFISIAIGRRKPRVVNPKK